MGGEEADGGHVDVGVLAGLEGPGASELNGHAGGVARECFAEGSGAASANVAVEDLEEAGCALGRPDTDNTHDERELGQGADFEVQPDADDSCDDKSNVQVFEGLIGGMSNDGRGLDADGEECAGALGFCECSSSWVGGGLTMKPYVMKASPVIDSATADQPSSCTVPAMKAAVWTMASSTTILPNHRWSRLKVSKDKWSQLMSGLFRAAMIKRGIYINC